MFWYPLLAVLIWSGNAIVCKLAAGTIEPGVIAFYRWLLAWLLVTPFMARTVWQQRQQIRIGRLGHGFLASRYPYPYPDSAVQVQIRQAFEQARVHDLPGCGRQFPTPQPDRIL